MCFFFLFFYYFLYLFISILFCLDSPELQINDRVLNTTSYGPIHQIPL